MRIITDPANREGLTSASLGDWIETLLLAPLLPIAVLTVVVLAARLRLREPRPARVGRPGGDARA